MRKMLLPCNKTFAYDGLVKKNKSVSLFINLSFGLGIALAVIFAVLAAINGFQTVYLILAAVFLIAGFAARAVLRNAFKKNSRAIVNIYTRAYGVAPPPLSTVMGYNRANYEQLAQYIYPQPLICWISYADNTLNFISQRFCEITKKEKFDAAYSACIGSDFGVLSVKTEKIDSYMLQPNGLCVLVVYDNEDVRRLEFDGRGTQFFDGVIPTLEYHFKTAKKD